MVTIIPTENDAYECNVYIASNNAATVSLDILDMKIMVV